MPVNSGTVSVRLSRATDTAIEWPAGGLGRNRFVGWSAFMQAGGATGDL